MRRSASTWACIEVMRSASTWAWIEVRRSASTWACIEVMRSASTWAWIEVRRSATGRWLSEPLGLQYSRASSCSTGGGQTVRKVQYGVRKQVLETGIFKHNYCTHTYIVQ